MFRILLCWLLKTFMSVFSEECKDCHHKSPAPAPVQLNTEAAAEEGALKERPAEEVAARIAQQNQEEQDITAGRGFS